MATKIFILHPPNATYPEISAYASFFAGKYEVDSGDIRKYQSQPSKSDLILWCIMGFYPSQLAAGYIIHDYRSLSIAPLAKLKDNIKRALNAKPDLRIFQSPRIREAMSFEDNIPSIILPMGIPEWLLDMEPHNTDLQAKYCYIGSITSSRKMDLTIKAFLDNSPKEENFILAGPVEPAILKRFSPNPRLTFTGPLSQPDALSIAKRCEYSICSVPSEYPYNLQIPTKFLEYTALGKIVICNESPSNRLAHNLVNSSVIFTKDNIFEGKELETLPISKNQIGTEITELTWPKVINSSGILEFI